MVKSGRHNPQARRLGQHDDAFGMGVGGNVYIVDRHQQKSVAHAAADKQGPMARLIQQLQKLLQIGVVDPICVYPHHIIRSAKALRIRAVAPQM